MTTEKPTVHLMPQIEVPPIPSHLSYSRDITHCHPYIRERWPALLKKFQHESGYDLIITCTWRSVIEQKRLYAKGRTEHGTIVTNCDGVDKMSMHNHYPARAIDVAVDIDPTDKKTIVTWQASKYEPLVKICEELNLISGGSWNSFQDWPHIEMPPGMI